jgi:ATP adenylyltransferase
MDYFFNFEKLTYLNEKKPDGCILCLVREASPEVTDLSVYRDDYFIVSLNLYPYNPGHVLIFPARHIEDIRDYTEEEERAQSRLLRTTIDILDELYRPQAYNIGYNMGLSAGASISHIHLHVIPRYPREIGIADLIAGRRVLVEDLMVTRERLKEAFLYKRND